MTRHKLTKLILGLCVTVLALSACGSRETTPSPDQMRTYVAETISVQLTRTEIARPTATPTPTLAPTATMAPPTSTVSVPTAQLVNLQAHCQGRRLPPNLPRKPVLMVVSGPIAHQLTAQQSPLAASFPWWLP